MGKFTNKQKGWSLALDLFHTCRTLFLFTMNRYGLMFVGCLHPPPSHFSLNLLVYHIFIEDCFIVFRIPERTLIYNHYINSKYQNIKLEIHSIKSLIQNRFPISSFWVLGSVSQGHAAPLQIWWISRQNISLTFILTKRYSENIWNFSLHSKTSKLHIFHSILPFLSFLSSLG